MAGRGLTLEELQTALTGPVRIRITATLEPAGQWASARWSCGCRAEGYRVNELLLMERCNGHRSVRLVELAGSSH